MSSRQRTKSFKWFTLCIVLAQIFSLTATGVLTTLQPTPQMARTAARELGVSEWLAEQAAGLMQPFFGAPETAQAAAINDLTALSTNQIQTTIYPEENMVVNGSFELSPIIANGTGTRIYGWTVLSGNSDIWNWWVSPDSSNKQLHVSGNQQGAVAQTVTGLEAGQSYYFEFDYTSETGSQTARVQLIDSGGTSVISDTVTSPGRPDGPGWSFYRNTFVAPADGQIEIRFTQLSPVPGTLQAFTVDDVRIARRLTNYVINGSFEGGRTATNLTTDIPGWTVTAGNVDIWGAYYRPDGSTRQLYLSGNTQGTIEQTVSGLTPGQTYFLEFDYSTEGNLSRTATVDLLDSGGGTVLTQNITSPGDPNNTGWLHFRQTFVAPGDGQVKVRFTSTAPAGNNGVAVDAVRIAAEPLNWVVNGDSESGRTQLNIPNANLPGWTITRGQVDIYQPGQLFNKALDLNGSPGDGMVEQTVTGLSAGQIYAFQLNYVSNGNGTRHAYVRLLDSASTILFEKRIVCDFDVNSGWCTLRHNFAAPADGQVKIVLENDETDGNGNLGMVIDNVMISRDINFVINGTFNTGPQGSNQPLVPGWELSASIDIHGSGGYDGSSFGRALDLDGTNDSNNATVRQTLLGLTPGQSYTLRYNFASTANNIDASFRTQVLPATGPALVDVTQATGLNSLPGTRGWQENRHTFTAPADGRIDIIFQDLETDGNINYGALLDNIEVFGRAAAGMDIDICSGNAKMPATSGPGGVLDALQAWYDAGVGVTQSGGAVSGWDDKTGHGHNTSQPTVANQPAYESGATGINFNPSINFGALPSVDFLSIRHPQAANNRVFNRSDDGTVIAAGDNRDVASPHSTLIGWGNDGNNPQLATHSSKMQIWNNGSNPVWTPGSTNAAAAQTVVNNQPYLFGWQWLNGAEGLNRGMDTRLDGFGVHYPDMEGTDIQYSGSAANNSEMHIGWNDCCSEDWNGRISEIAVFSRKLTAAELQRVESYFAIKYGITLDQVSAGPKDYVAADSTVVWDATANATYNKDIAGIGRDDVSALNQKQSKSANTGALVTVGLGTIAADNASNPNNFTADKSFLVWGSDTGSPELSDPYIPASLPTSVDYVRMGRVWKVQETGTVGTVQVAVAAGAQYLIVADDASFTTGVQEIPLSGGSFPVDFTDGQFFTFARTQPAPGGVNAGLAHWIKADSQVFNDAGNTPATAGQTVEQWNDQSGQGLHVTANSAGQTPVYLAGTAATNFNPALDFTNDYLINTNRIVETTDGLSLFSVGATRVFNGVRTMYSLGTNGNEPTVDLEATWISPYNTASSPTNVDLFNNQMTLNQPMIWGLRAANDVANDLRFSFQGEEVATTLEIVSTDPAYGNRVHVGTGVDSVWDGLIQEGITYNRPLSSAEMQRVNSYLALKYGVTLRTVDSDPTITEGDYVASDGTTQVWDYVANTAYHSDVAGIGRDDASGLHQKQSKSINSGSLVTIGLGAIAADNASNPNSFAADFSFLVWGNDAGATTVGTAITGLTGGQRMDRIWKTQETGTVGSVLVQISTGAITLGANEFPLLIRSTDAAFDSSDTLMLLADNGAGAYEAAIDFDDGDFFTFGKASDADADSDGVPDVIEIVQGTDPTDPNSYLDTDGDGVPDYVEEQDGTDPNDANDYKDTDGGGVPDYIETVLLPNNGLPATDPNNPADDDQDSDGDGVPDWRELLDGTDPNDPDSYKDSDGDGVPDYVEGLDGTDPNDPNSYQDTDGDGVPDYIENRDGTNPTDASDYKDSDGDLVPDYIENRDGTDPNDKSSYKDTDGDLVPDYIEAIDGTDPNDVNDFKDTDGGGAPDYVEQVLWSPAGNINDPSDDLRDTDGDGVPDYQELKDGTDPNDATSYQDLDGDGVPDYVENQDGTNPTDPSSYKDSDGDLVPDYVENRDGTDPNDKSSYKDSDGDLVPDYIENIDGTDPNDPSSYQDSDGGGAPDYMEQVLWSPAGDINDPSDDLRDSDGDGVPDYQELMDGTDPTDPNSYQDTDGDGVPDYVEQQDGTDPNDASSYQDSDGDLVPDYIEQRDGTDPNDKSSYKDSDGDWVPDYVENIDGTDPNDKLDYKDTDGGGAPDYVEQVLWSPPGDVSDPSDDLRDTDGDGVPDIVEAFQGTNPNDPNSYLDTDGDGVPDYVENQDGTDPTDPTSYKDSDGDGVPDYVESKFGTDPNDPTSYPDADGDLVPDYIEQRDGTDPGNPNDFKDSDGGGVPDYVETVLYPNTGLPAGDPNDPSDDGRDSDGGGVSDYEELKLGTDPTNPADDSLDSDGDGVPDAVEIIDGTDPNDPLSYKDTDGDKVPDFVETKDGTNPNDPTSYKDTDGDGVPDYVETKLDGTDPNDPDSYKDTDGDGVPDYVENKFGTDPNDPTSYPDGDGDLVPDYIEQRDGTDPGNPNDFKDSDGGGVPDYVETVLYPNTGLPTGDPNDPSDDGRDSDSGGVSDYEELKLGTDPTNPADDSADSDGDGVPDAQELIDGTDPNDPLSYKDSDGDGVPDFVETNKDGTNPFDPNSYKDSDGDGVPDYVETKLDGTNPADPNSYQDSDGDGVPDYIENRAGTDPNDPASYPDADGDLVPDYIEQRESTNPFDPNSFKDSDGGGVPDYVETVLYPNLGLPAGNPNDPSDDNRDSDGGGVSDYEELKLGTDPTNPTDDSADSDGDGVPDAQELIDGTDPNDPLSYKDTDGDLVPDYVENKDGTDPNDPTSYKDSDDGGVPDYVETVLYPNLGLPIGDPNNRLDDQRDTDNGGVSDYEELKLGTDPLNSDDDQAAQPTRVIWLPLVHDHHNDCATTMTCQ